MSMNRGFGRLRQWDDRNRGFLLPRRDARERRRRFWNLPKVLDQGNTPQCVAFSSFHWLTGGPVSNRHMKFTPAELYRWAQDADEWPGADYEGTSALGAMKALKERGYIREYRWALDVPTIVDWVLTTGPMLMGTNWYSGMSKLNQDGFIVPSGSIEGGHEWCVIGADLDKRGGSIRMVNSWGPSWGQKGRAWLSCADLARLLAEEGDAMTPTEIKVGNKIIALGDIASDTALA